jgi:transposase
MLQAALILPSSHGQVEGQVTILAFLKRHSAGHPQLEPLRQRMLHAAWCTGSS